MNSLNVLLDVCQYGSYLSRATSLLFIARTPIVLHD